MIISKPEVKIKLDLKITFLRTLKDTHKQKLEDELVQRIYKDLLSDYQVDRTRAFSGFKTDLIVERMRL